MKNDIKIGDIIETCSLMPGVVMKLEGNDVEVRSLEVPNDGYNGKGWSGHGLNNCGLKLLTPEQALKRLSLGKNKLEELWTLAEGDQDAYDKLIDG